MGDVYTDDADKQRYVAHVSEDGLRYESVRTHLEEVADLSAEFARPLHAESMGYVAGLLHDIGKYSKEFQNRILYNGPKVDHSTAGAYELYRLGSPLAYCVAGHHGGLPDGGAAASYDSTLLGRINKAQNGEIPSCEAWRSEISMPRIDLPSLPCPPQRKDDACYAFAFLTRMLFSCLVDADFLCTERFMRGRPREPLDSDSLESLRDKLEDKLSSFYPPSTPLNRVRCELLDECKDRAALSQGVFSLTAPTGAGKTYALMRFALQHACAEGRSMRRVIVAEPYTSIIEQNAAVYRDVFGANNVLEHHASFDFDSIPSDDGVHNRLRLAAENWDVPVVITTNVQLFESLHSNKTSRCRKLHNIAGSVIVLDEAQMIPTDYLFPCIRALVELVRNYGCSVVLCSATQPALRGYFEKAGLSVREIVTDVPHLFANLKRVSFQAVGKLSDEELARRMIASGSALCIVNSRKQALRLFELLEEFPCDGDVYHLTTLMHPMHRKRVLAEISKSMKGPGARCLVVATSLVEAGVDMDFPTVFRAIAGVDSMVQAAGRCNREGKRPSISSLVYLFDPADSYPIPSEVVQRADISRGTVRGLTEAGSILDLGAPDVVSSFFGRLYFYKGASALDKAGILQLLERYAAVKGMYSIDYKTVSEQFRLIEDGSYSVVIPDEKIADAVECVREGRASRGDLRRISLYSVSIYEHDLKALYEAGAIEKLGNDSFVLLDESRYSNQTGLNVAAGGGEALFW